MCAASSFSTVRTEDRVGPFGDKHSLTVDGYREIHLGAQAVTCRECREAKRLASGDTNEA